MASGDGILWNITHYFPQNSIISYIKDLLNYIDNIQICSVLSKNNNIFQIKFNCFWWFEIINALGRIVSCDLKYLSVSY